MSGLTFITSFCLKHTHYLINLEFTMSKITAKSTKSAILAAYEDAIRELELVKRQLADVTTEKGVLLNQLAAQEPAIPQAFEKSYAALVDERNELIAENQRLTEAAVAVTEELDAAKERIAKQGQVIAAQPKSAPLKPAPKPLPVSAEVESQPIVEVNDFDRAMYAKFQALPRETRLEIIDFARPEWGHVGIHNIVEIRAAWRAAKPISA